MNRSIQSYRFEKLAPAGFYVALRVGFAFPVAEQNAFPPAWIETYTAKGLMLYDPVMRWVYEYTGATRWSALRIDDPRDVLGQAAAHGLHYGAVVCSRNPHERAQHSFGSFARADREFTDQEIGQLADAIGMLHRAVRPPANLTNAELEVLRMMRDGLLMKQIADELGVSIGAIKQRLKNAKLKLGAKTSSHATALALEFGLL